MLIIESPEMLKREKRKEALLDWMRFAEFLSPFWVCRGGARDVFPRLLPLPPRVEILGHTSALVFGSTYL